MRSNRRMTKKMSVAKGMTLRIGSILMALFVVVIINLLAESSCQQLMKANGEKMRQIKRLEAERQRASARWEEMQTPENLERMLLKHGLNMRYSKPDQIVRMQKNGLVQPGSKCMPRRREGRTADYRKKGRR